MKLALVLVVAACSKHDRAPEGPLPFEETITDLPPGTSDLTLDDTGTIWAVAERGHIIAEITGFPAAAPTIKLHPVDGVPDGVDTEAITWLGGAKFAVGTEGQVINKRYRIVKIENAAVVVEDILNNNQQRLVLSPPS